MSAKELVSEKMKCKREECRKEAHNLEAGYCSSICNIKALESKLAEAEERLRNESN